MPGLRESINEFLRGDPRRYWPELRNLSRERAAARFRAYHDEERRRMGPWHTIVVLGLGIGASLMLLIHGFGWVTDSWQPLRFWLQRWSGRVLLPLNLVFLVANIAFTRRLRRRIAARLAEERSLGHVPVCLACHYDLRATPADARCPECGKPVSDTRSGRAPTATG